MQASERAHKTKCYHCCCIKSSSLNSIRPHGFCCLKAGRKEGQGQPDLTDFRTNEEERKRETRDHFHWRGERASERARVGRGRLASFVKRPSCPLWRMYCVCTVLYRLSLFSPSSAFSSVFFPRDETAFPLLFHLSFLLFLSLLCVCLFWWIHSAVV